MSSFGEAVELSSKLSVYYLRALVEILEGRKPVALPLMILIILHCMVVNICSLELYHHDAGEKTENSTREALTTSLYQVNKSELNMSFPVIDTLHPI